MPQPTTLEMRRVHDLLDHIRRREIHLGLTDDVIGILGAQCYVLCWLYGCPAGANFAQVIAILNDLLAENAIVEVDSGRVQ